MTISQRKQSLSLVLLSLIVVSSSSSSSKSLPDVEILFEFSQQSTASQVALKSSVITTRSKREIARLKSEAQKQLDFQRRYEAEMKTINKAKERK